MANWVEGKLKIRGKPEDIKRWVEECLHCYTTNWLGDVPRIELFARQRSPGWDAWGNEIGEQDEK